MIELSAGNLLRSTEALRDTDFAGATILLTEYNDNGAVGFVINQPFGRSLNELEEFKHCRSVSLYNGGPVDTEHLFFIHKRPDLIEEGNPITENIFFGGNFSQATAAINNEKLSLADIKIFVGYCGWDKGELEAEIEEGSWTLVHPTEEMVFSK